MSTQRFKEPSICRVCNKNEARDRLFCEECLSYKKRDKTFQKRLRVIIKVGLEYGAINNTNIKKGALK